MSNKIFDFTFAIFIVAVLSIIFLVPLVRGNRVRAVKDASNPKKTLQRINTTI
jgi:hypothetical protein